MIYDHLRPYQKQRIKDFLSDEPSYQVQQSIITIGSGGIYGKYKEEATQTQLKFLPVAASDFIFAYLCERFGFVGALLLFGTYIIMILHILSLTRLDTKDYLANSVLVAVAILIFLYSSVNIAMTIGLSPVVGVPLPFFSHGGSFFINFVLLFAIIENLLAFKFKF